jgi:hypothetical protein
VGATATVVGAAATVVGVTATVVGATATAVGVTVQPFEVLLIGRPGAFLGVRKRKPQDPTVHRLGVSANALSQPIEKILGTTAPHFAGPAEGLVEPQDLLGLMQGDPGSRREALQVVTARNHPPPLPMTDLGAVNAELLGDDLLSFSSQRSEQVCQRGLSSHPGSSLENWRFFAQRSAFST